MVYENSNVEIDERNENLIISFLIAMSEKSTQTDSIVKIDENDKSLWFDEDSITPFLILMFFVYIILIIITVFI
jgi:hypothetical protein